ncbi:MULTISPECIES: phospholipase D family protein [Methylobacter]
MTIYSTAEELRAALNKVNPSKIAVAFIGTGWEEFLLSDNLEEIVLSPTVGSNPYAIRQIIDQIGINKVHFLDKLHSKIYIGANSALLGSCNLSRNGFADNGNFEVSVIFAEKKDLKQLNEIFDGYRNKANDSYPDSESKEKQLEVLYRQWQVSKESRTDSPLVNNGEDDVPSISDWVPNNQRIHITGWSSDLTFNEEVIRAALPDVGNPDDYFDDQLSLHEDDKIEEGDWILCYQCTKKDGSPHQKGKIDWVYVHHVIANGGRCEDDDHFTKLVGQVNNKKLSPLPPPFVLDAPTKKLIRASLNLPQFEAFHTEKLLANNSELVPKFLGYVRNEQRRSN